jgi:proteasome accessory factor B
VGTGSPGAAQIKTERLLNLVLVLLYARRPLAKAQIRRLVPQYGQSASVEAFERMFERDKDELRELGVPLVTEGIDALHDDEPGYRIHQREYALPEIDFAPDELAVLGLASRTWAQASLAGPAAQALRKLRAAGVERDTDTLIGIEPRLRTAEPAFDAVKDAVLRQVPLRFGYRRRGDEGAVQRHVRPWSLVSSRGRWYLNAYDLEREAPRVFRLSRITGPVRTAGRPGSFEVPGDHQAEVMVERFAAPPRAASPAVVRVRAGAGHAIRRRSRTVGEIDERWSLVDLDYTDVDEFAEELAGYGPDVVVQAPAELVAAVVERLRAAAVAHTVGGAPAGPGPRSADGGR